METVVGGKLGHGDEQDQLHEAWPPTPHPWND